ncbi:hypothetical protein IEO21_06103 [Rhodonia placenta]|uniref:Phosducin thioredoxin-like domain-containing protein n=1 Tax=Rhodonia placenta TaxID=104341 RepID=A0A8H7P0N8_9APHY|nr:hypothetical protein IEO21_06103 [Postia placenta]
MDGNIEELVLSGKLFNPPSRSSSPVHSRSPSPVHWPNDDADYDYDSDAERRRAIEERIAAQEQPESIGMGPGRTGVKGVLRDHAEAAALARSNRTQEIMELNKAMEKASLGGKTWAEEERERLAEKAALEGKASLLMEGRGARKGHFGHLMEVGVRSFVQAVEEDRSIFVVVHIYDPSLERCASLDENLSRLARTYLSTKFIRARAGALGFASSTSSTQILVPGRYPSAADEDDPYAGLDSDDSEDENRGDEGWEDDIVDTDVLPTMLVYRGGVLEHTWVRVDWEAKSGIEELLTRYNILRDSNAAGGVSASRGYSPSFDDDDLDDGELVFGGSDDEN